MALQKQFTPTFFKGLNQKPPKGQVVPGTLDALSNGYAHKGDAQGVQIIKRNGIKAFAKTVVDQTGTLAQFGLGAITSAQKLATFGNETLLTTATNTFSKVSAPGGIAWAPKNLASNVTVRSTPVTGSTQAQTMPDTCVYQGVQVTAYESFTNLVTVWVADATTGAGLYGGVIGTNGASGGAETRPKVVGVGAYIWVFWLDGANVRAASLPVAVPGLGFNAAQTIRTDGLATTATQQLAVQGYAPGSSISVAYLNNANHAMAFQWDANGAGVLAGIDTGNVWTYPMGWLNPDDAFASATVTLVGGTALQLKKVVFTASTMAITTNANCGAAVDVVSNITGVILGGTPSIVYESRPAGYQTWNYAVYLASGSGASAGTMLMLGLGLASQAFILGGLVYFLGSYDSPANATYFLYNLSLGGLSAKSQPGTAGGSSARTGGISSVTVSGNTATVGTLAKVRVNTAGGQFLTVTGTQSLVLTAADATLGRGRELGGFFAPGGIPQVYDSALVTEHQFNVAPEAPTVAQGAGLLTTATAYGVCLVWKWIDAQGNVHRSAPSPVVTTTLSGGHTSLIVAPWAYTITGNATQSPFGVKSNITVELYGTISNGTNLYLITAVSNDPLNHSLPNITFSATDATIQAGEPLYTTGGVLNNQPAPACTAVAVCKNRLFAFGCENRQQVRFAKEFVKGLGMAYNDAFSMEVPSWAGPVVTGIAMDGYVIAFTATTVWIAAGEYPDQTGGTNTIPSFQQLPINAGCRDTESVLLTKDGVFFRDVKGFYLIDRGLNVSFVGAPVEDYTDVITGACTVDSLNQARFFSASGTCLVYDLYFHLWYPFVYPWGAVAAISSNGVPMFADSTGTVYQETSGYDDNGIPISTQVTMSFMSFAGLQGFQRIYALQVFGRYIGPHTIQVELRYDHNDTTFEYFTIDAATLLGLYAYGGDLPYFGSEAIYGQGSGLERFELRPYMQKCTSIQVIIKDQFPTGVGSGGFAINSVGFTLGIKPGLGRLPTSLRIPPQST